MARKGAVEQQRAAAAKTSLAPVQAAEKTAPPSPTNTSKRGTPRERGAPEDSPTKKARLSEETAGDTENVKEADADTLNAKEPAADTENGKESAADTENAQGPAADTGLAVAAFENNADGGKKYNFRTRKLKPASSSVEGNLSEDDEGEEDDDEVEDEPKVTPTKIHPNLARIKDKVNRGRPVKPVSPKGIIF